MRRIFIVIFCLFCGCSIHEDRLRIVRSADRGLLNKVENFRLLDDEGKSHELYYYSDMKAVVLIWQGNGCPIVRQSIGEIMKLKEEYEKEGVVFFMVNANPQDDRFSIQQEAKEYGIGIPILEDDAQIVTTGLGVTRTGTVIVVDVKKGWKIVYEGAINDQFGYESQKPGLGREYVREAIESIFKETEAKENTSEVKGCLINLEGMNKKVTYVHDVAPILIKKCLECHSAGGVGPWEMKNYEELKGWGPMIREVVMTKRMPPWNPDPYYGKFKYDIALRPEEVRKIVYWVERGMERGEGDDPLKKEPQPDHDKWELGQPDMIFSHPEEHLISATGVVPYYYVEAEKIVDQDIWLRASEVKPSNPKVVHHINILAIPPGEFFDKKPPFFFNYNNEHLRTDFFIAGFGTGKRKFEFSENVGKFIPKGSKIIFQIHYESVGKPEKCKIELGLYIHKNPPEHQILIGRAANRFFEIPPLVKNYKLSMSQVFRNDVLVYILVPHMHYRGKSMKFIAVYPDQKQEILLSIPHYQFQWENMYYYDEPKKLPAGTKVICEALYDNSPQNLYNPDPFKKVGWGLHKEDEMCVCNVIYTELKDKKDEKN